MKPSLPLLLLSALVVLLSVFTILATMLWPPGPQPAAPKPASVVSAFGEEVALYGRGLYRNDTLLIGSGFEGANLVILLLGVPLLAVASWLRLRGSLRGALLQLGALSYMLYVWASLAFGAFYNELFPAYLLLTLLSLWALIAGFVSLDSAALADRFAAATFPRRAVAGFLAFAGLVLFAVWFGLDMLPAYLAKEPPPTLDHYHTVVTYTMDLAIVMPALLVAAWLLARRVPLGYPAAAALLVCSGLMGVNVGAATVAQWLAGYPYTAGQVVALVAPFVLMGAAAVWLSLRFLRATTDRAVS